MKTEDEVKMLHEVGDGLLKIYGQDHPRLEADIEKASCTKGCTWCCYQVVAVNLAEGVVLAREIMKRSDWKRIAKDMAVRAKQTPADVSREDYMYRKLPCPLLDTEEKTCRVYDVRPAACRFYYVITDPAYCSPDDPHQEVIALDCYEEEEAVMMYAHKAFGGPLPVSAPLPVMVLYAMAWLSQGNKKKLDFMKKVTSHVVTPYAWMSKMLKNFDAFVGEKSTRITQKELEERL